MGASRTAGGVRHAGGASSRRKGLGEYPVRPQAHRPINDGAKEAGVGKRVVCFPSRIEAAPSARIGLEERVSEGEGRVKAGSPLPARREGG